MEMTPQRGVLGRSALAHSRLGSNIGRIACLRSLGGRNVYLPPIPVPFA
jgi:hypothetical protein